MERRRYVDGLDFGLITKYGQFLGIAVLPSACSGVPTVQPPTGLRWVAKAPGNALIRQETAKAILEWTLLAVDSTKDVLLEYTRQGGDKMRFLSEIGSRVTTGLGASISRIAGLVTSAGQVALDPTIAPDLAQGAAAFHQTYNDPNPDTQGLISGDLHRRRLAEAMHSIDAPDQPYRPSKTVGNTRSYDLPVKLNAPLGVTGSGAAPRQLRAAAPGARALGFEYKAATGGPLFATVALPALAQNQAPYTISIKQGGAWKQIASLRFLKEFRFPKPVGEFRVTGIPSLASIDPADRDGRFVTVLSFNKTGRFRGTIKAVASP